MKEIDLPTKGKARRKGDYTVERTSISLPRQQAQALRVYAKERNVMVTTIISAILSRYAPIRAIEKQLIKEEQSEQRKKIANDNTIN